VKWWDKDDGQVTITAVDGASKPETGSVTRLLQSWRDGRQSALDELMPLVYDELRRLAASYLRRERADHTLQPTALVHEAYARLVDTSIEDCETRGRFYGIAAHLMRQILVDHARRRHAAKRGSGRKVSLDEAGPLADEGQAFDLLALDRALDELARLDPRQSRIVELRFFGGLREEEIAEALGTSLRTVKRDWAMAKAWLHGELAGDGARERQ
jgi:RNA polymerase sigma factor (TIGR02999 family)